MRRPILSGTQFENEFDGLQLTPEQQKIREELRAKQEEQWELQEKERNLEQARQVTEQFDFIAGHIQRHPFFLELIGLQNSKSKLDKYMELALPAVIAAHPGMDAQSIADTTWSIARAMIAG